MQGEASPGSTPGSSATVVATTSALSRQTLTQVADAACSVASENIAEAPESEGGFGGAIPSDVKQVFSEAGVVEVRICKDPYMTFYRYKSKKYLNESITGSGPMGANVRATYGNTIEIQIESKSYWDAVHVLPTLAEGENLAVEQGWTIRQTLFASSQGAWCNGPSSSCA